MPDSPRVLHLDPRAPLLAKELGDAVLVGESFALISAGLESSAPVSALLGSIGAVSGPTEARAICLWGDKSHALPGGTAQGRTVPRWAPVGLWLDRLLYTPDNAVNLVIAAPGLGGGVASLVLERRGVEPITSEVPLRGDGVGTASVRGLEPGSWRARISAGEGTRRAETRFFVTQGKTPALEARWRVRDWVRGEEGLSLAFEIRLDAYGHPLSGPVQAAVLDLSHREVLKQTAPLAPDPFGVVRGVLPWPMEGAGVLSLAATAMERTEVKLIARPYDTLGALSMGPASSERLTVLERISNDGAMGLQVQGRSTERTVAIEAIDGDRVRLTAECDWEALEVAVIEPLSGGLRTVSIGAMAKGEQRELDIGDAVGAVAVGGFAAGAATESWAAWARSGPPLGLAWAEGIEDDPGGGVCARAGSRPSLTIRAGSAEAPAAVLVRVCGESLSGEAPEGTLAPLGRSIWSDARALFKTLGHDPSPSPLFEAAGGERAVEAALRSVRAVLEGREVKKLDSAPAESRGRKPHALAILPVEGAQPGAMAIDIVEVAGEMTYTLPEMPRSGRVRVEAIAATAGGWSQATIGLRAGDWARASLWMPPFVDPGDDVLARLRVETWSGIARLLVTVDDEPVDVTVHGRGRGSVARVVAPGGALPAETAASFALRPGLWHVSIEGPAGEAPKTFEGIVSEAGRRKVQRARFSPMMPDEEPGDGELLATLDDVRGALVSSVMSAPWQTCESRAAQMVAAGISLALGDGNAARWSDVLTSQAAALAALFVPGKGFALHTPRGPMDAGLSVHTVRHLLRLEALEDEVSDPSARLAIGEAGRLARRAALAADVVLPPPPDGLRHADDADLMLRFRPDRLAVAAATARARLKRRASRRDAESAVRARDTAPRGALLRRCDVAYGARVLLQTGDPIDRRAALDALAEALSTPRRGFLDGAIGTIDGAALLFALHALSDCEGEELWNAWTEWDEDDLTDPADDIPLSVHLRQVGRKTPELRFRPGTTLELHVDLGEPRRGDGAVFGDVIEVHLPAALSPVSPEAVIEDGGVGVRGRRLQIPLEGRHSLTIPLRAIATTSGSLSSPRAQHLAVGLRNFYDAGRGRGMVGLDVFVGPEDKGLGSRLKRFLG